MFCLWYGQGPGVDRSGDALRHANLAGTSRLGGVVALLGDDHTCESSTTAHHSEYAMVDASIPVLNPAGVQEILYTRERRRERRLIERYEQVVASLLEELDHANHAVAVEIASLPERIRGFGHVKARSIEQAGRREAELLERFGAAIEPPDAA